MTKVAIYTPVLNEQVHAERWHRSGADADHQLWLDTGSDDWTVRHAKALGITVHECRIDPFRFDDARNVALSLIPDDIDVVLQVDADETLCPGWYEAICAAAENEEHNRWTYRVVNATRGAWGEIHRTNCHRRFGFRWAHAVHEVIVGPEPDAHIEGLVLEHHPDLDKDRTYILERLEYWARREPRDVRLRFYLGREQCYRGQWVQARQTLWSYLHDPAASWPPERQEAWMMLARMDDDPERWLWKAVSEVPKRREPFVRLAQHHLNNGDPFAAEEMIAAADRRHDRSIYTTHRDCWDQHYQRLKQRVGEARETWWAHIRSMGDEDG